jgi:Ca-activated chloride channel family protein
VIAPVPPLEGAAVATASTREERERYQAFLDNPVHETAAFPTSTFAADVDTASYSNVRRFLLADGHLPPKDAVRVEEMLNYFTYSYPAPADDAPIAASLEVSECPWTPSHDLVRIGLQAKRIDASNLPPRNLVFLLDTSGSMMPENRLPLVKKAMRMLVDQLTAKDTVAIVTYAGASGVALPPTSGADTGTIVSALSRLEAGGSTNGAAGIKLAYELAESHKNPDGINRVILSTDGDFNVGVTSDADLVNIVEQERGAGVYLSVLGVGEGNLNDRMMEKLADKGHGNYAYLDRLDEARKALAKEAGSSLVTVADDVKIQADFDPTQVKAYRLLGYEDRVMQNEDFNDDSKGAGDMGAGHAVTALYEIEPGAAPLTSPVTLRIRYKEPGGKESKLLSFRAPAPHPLAQASSDFRFAAAVGAFGMLLRDSPFKGNASFALVDDLASGASHDSYRTEFRAMAAKAASIEASHGGVASVAR